MNSFPLKDMALDPCGSSTSPCSPSIGLTVGLAVSSAGHDCVGAGAASLSAKR